MESIDILKNNICDLCERILEDQEYLEQLCGMLEHDPDAIEKRYSGKLMPEILDRLVRLSYTNSLVQIALVPIVDILEANDITHDAFKLLMSHPKNKVKKAICVSLSHKKLPIGFLRCLCETNYCFECYFEYVLSIYSSSEYGADEFDEALDFFSKSSFSGMWDELQDELFATPICSAEKFSALIARCNTGDGLREPS